MSLKDREVLILEYLKERREATVEELCRALFVSEPTMRRDLAKLNESGKIIRTYGGAAFRNELGKNLPFEYREREHSDAKITIGKKCLSLINDGDTVMIDASSSALALMREIAAERSVMIVTNSAKAPIVLSESKVKIFVTGGELSPGSYAYVGHYTEDFLRSFNADICFFSVRTLTHNGELTDNAIAENSVRRVMLSRSKKRVLMLDSGKIGGPCANTLCTLDSITHVVSEREIAHDFSEYFDKFI